MLFGDSSYINLSSYDLTYNDDGSILLKPKNKAMKNDSYRTDSADSSDFKMDAYDLYIYRMENAYRDSRDPLREFPPVYDSLPNDQRLDAAVEAYKYRMENAWKY